MNEEKLKDLIAFSETHDAEETKHYILESLQGSAFEMQKEDINQAFYELHTKNIFFKDANGLHVSIVEGEGDRAFGVSARSGMDILINNPLKNEAYYLFADGERVRNESMNLSNDITKQDVIDYLESNHDVNTNTYKYLDEELKNDQDIIESFTQKIEDAAKLRSMDEENYSDISPYGGLDVYVHPWQDYYLDKLEELRDGNCDKLIDYAEKHFCLDEANQKYIKDELKRNEKICYYAQNKEKYIEIEKYKFNNLYANDEINKKHQEIKDLEQKVKETNENIKYSSNELEKMQKGFISRIINRSKINSLKDNVSAMQAAVSNYQEEINDANERITFIKEDLALEKDKPEPVKFDFEYSLKDHYIETYDHAEPVESIEKMLDRMEAHYPVAAKSIESLNHLLTISNADKAFDHSHNHKISGNDHTDKIRKNIQESFSKPVSGIEDIKAENLEQEIDAADYTEESFGGIRI